MRPKSYDHPLKIGDADWTERGPARKRGSAPRSLGSLRLVEMERLLRHRAIEATPAESLVIVIHHVLHEFADPTGQDAIDAAREHLAVLARHLPLAEREALVERGALSCRKWSAKALGEALALTDDDRRLLDIRTIRFAGQTRREQREAKRDRDRAGAARRRRDRGAIERDTYVSESVADEARRLGVARSTIYRRRARELSNATRASHITPEGYHTGDAPVAPFESVKTSTCRSDRAAGPRAPARAPAVESPVAVREVIARVADVAASARRLADRIDRALTPVRLAARRVSGGG